MKLMLPFLAALLLLTATACNSDDDSSSTPIPTATVATTPQQTPTQASSSPTATPGSSTTATPGASTTATPAATGTPASGGAITADNFGDLTSIAQTSVNAPQYMAWQQDGKLLVASRSDATLIDNTGATQTAYTATGNEAIVGISQQGQIAVSSDMTTIQLHDLQGNTGATITAPSQFGSVDFSEDGTLLATSRLDQIAVDIWNTDTGEMNQEVTGYQTAAPVYSATISPKNDKLIWHARADIQITDLGSGDMSPKMEHEDFVSVVSMNQDESMLATTWGTTATLWNPDTGERIHDLDQDGFAAAQVFVPDSNLIVVATANGLTLWNTQTFEQLGTIDLPDVRQVAISDDGADVATIDQNGQVQIWAP